MKRTKKSLQSQDLPSLVQEITKDNMTPLNQLLDEVKEQEFKTGMYFLLSGKIWSEIRSREDEWRNYNGEKTTWNGFISPSACAAANSSAAGLSGSGLFAATASVF